VELALHFLLFATDSSFAVVISFSSVPTLEHQAQCSANKKSVLQCRNFRDLGE